MATVTKSGNYLTITSTGTQEDELVLNDYLDGRYYACIEVTLGDFQFNVGSAITSDNRVYTTDEKAAPAAFGTGLGNIRYKASAASRTFSIVVS